MLHASRKVHSDSRDVAVLVHFDLACVHASADGHTDSCERVEQLHTALHGLRRQVEDCQQAVAGALDQPAAVRLDQHVSSACERCLMPWWGAPRRSNCGRSPRVRSMVPPATAEQQLRADPAAWDTYVRERDAWLNPQLAAS